MCDLSSKECMLQKCGPCLGMEAIQAMQENFEDLDEEIRFKQWVNVRSGSVGHCLGQRSNGLD